jgi:hypothetical protein
MTASRAMSHYNRSNASAGSSAIPDLANFAQQVQVYTQLPLAATSALHSRKDRHFSACVDGPFKNLNQKH